MVGVAQVRQIALSLPGAVDESAPERLAFSVGGRGFAWSFMQRDHPKAKRYPNLEVLAISCTLESKELLIEAASDRFFDDDHYRGYPAVLTRLPLIDEAELADLLGTAHAIQAAKKPKPVKCPKT
jgi:hypothetical protein